jgi:4-hydroxy-tetrahydrodipicolinate synthase
MDLSGVLVPMVTPASEDGEILESTIGRHTRFLVENDVHGLMPLGTTGEFSSFSREQRRAVVRTVVSESGETSVIAGCGGTNVTDVERYSVDAAEAGVDAIAVVTPYYLPATSEGLVEYYTAVADRSPVPVVLYHIPKLTGQSLPPGTVVDLASHENIVGIKDSTGDVFYHYELIQRTPSSFSVIQGNTAFVAISLRAGASGVVSAMANVFPGILTDAYGAHESGNCDRLMTVSDELIVPLAKAYRSMPTPAAMKHLLRLRGIDAGIPVLPLSELAETEKSTLEEAFDDVMNASGDG